jgi:AcrR family transcriptional regulator
VARVREQPLRADAARNRRALLDAATRVFGERGIEAPLDDIARSASVGNATLYRHFPTRCDLVGAVFAERMRDAVEAVERGLEEPDPWIGFRDYVVGLCRMQAEDVGLADVFISSVDAVGGELQELRARAYAGFTELAERAKRAGALRQDFSPDDMLVLLTANAGVTTRAGADARAESERLVSVFLDGLRAGPT